MDRDVAVIGGGPAGCSAGVFTARYGLDTVIFDRGRSSLKQCAYLENYLGFPGGIDIETLYPLMHSHAKSAGCDIVPKMVENVKGLDGHGFVVETRNGCITASCVIAATRYGGEYLLGVEDKDELYVTNEYRGKEKEEFDRSYAEHDGSTPVDGLYVASPSDEADRQAVIAAGRGARVGISVVSYLRRLQGYPDNIAEQYDWMRPEAELEDEWEDRDRWRTWFENRLPEYMEVDERLRELREEEIDRRLATYVSDEDVQERAERGQQRLIEHLDDELVLERAEEIHNERSSASQG